MKKIIIQIIIVSVLLISLFACDRFEHNFAPDDPQETPIQKFKDELTDIITNLGPSQMHEDSLATLYSDDYLNNGTTKQEMLNYFMDLTLIDSIKFTIDSLQFNPQTDEFSWHFSAFWENQTFADTTFNDILAMTDSVYQFYGNQSYGKTNVFVEFASTTTCNNCPQISSKLKELESENDNFIFITACGNKPDTPSQYIDDFLWYYPFSGVFPTSFFQGQFKLEGSTQAVIDEYDTRLSQISEWEAQALISNIQITEKKGEVEGSVDLTISEDVLLDDLYLRCALVEKESSLQYYHSDYMHNVVFGYEKIEVNNYNTTINFMVSSYYDTLPDDTEIIFWLQRMPADYDEDTCKIIAVKKR
ncbi:MAG: hypothetical protein KGY74_08645 [Candidatus Cloacimonetes bacterium]|nr:hypothetical protein [Candidatus Cloacimonadota bacterium]